MTKRQIDTIFAFIQTSNIGQNPTVLREIEIEYIELLASRRVRKQSRKHLLAVLHSTRALDTALQEMCNQYGIRNYRKGRRFVRSFSLGQYIDAFAFHAAPTLTLLPAAAARHFKHTIASNRNTYMHRAGAFPAGRGEINQLISEMHNLISTIVRL